MNVSILNILPNSREKRPDLIHRPPHGAHGFQTNRLKPTKQILLPIHRDLFEILTPCPRARWPVIVLLHHILEPDFFHPALIMLHIGPWAAEFLAAGHHDLVPFIQRGVYGGGTDVLEGKTSILKLEIPPGGERFEGLGDDNGGVFETCE